MNALIVTAALPRDPDRQVADAMNQEGPRLRNWVRRNVANPGEVEDIVQDVFFELVLAYRAMQPIENVGAWLFRVARNRITDLFRKRGRQPIDDQAARASDTDAPAIEDLLPDPRAGPEAAYARSVLIDELEQALAALPREQREAFIAHEIEGLSFQALAARTGVGVNTLIARKHSAVRQLRQRLRGVYEDFLDE